MLPNVSRVQQARLLELAPALGGLVVGLARVDPARAVRVVLFFPERRLRLEVVHDELAGGERIAAMAARDRHQHDLVVRLQLAVAVDHGVVHDLPARARLFDDLLDRVFGHARVVLERHRIIAAHLADEARHRADAVVLLDVEHLEPEVEVLRLDGDLHPPVTGGKKATSSPGFSGALAAAMSWLTATRTTFMSASASCQAPPRRIRCRRRPATVLAESGISTSSSGVPSRSRRLAKNSTLTFTRISPVELRISEEAHRFALANRLAGGIVHQPVGPGSRRQHRRILRVIEIQAALRVPFYAQELAPRVGLGPVEVGARLDHSRLGL